MPSQRIFGGGNPKYLITYLSFLVTVGHLGQNALTTIDQVPTIDQLTTAFGSGSGSAAATQLVSIASDPSTDAGIRLRAIRSLVGFCPPPTASQLGCTEQTTLHAILQDPTYTTASGGADVLVLRAAIEALGELKDPNDMSATTGFLDHSSRDVRATTALALRDQLPKLEQRAAQTA